MSEQHGLAVTRHYFPGGNTAAGYTGYMNELPDMSAVTYVIKGAPGVGKSTLMRAVGALLSQAGEDVDCFHCSGDPASLDAVFSRSRRLLIMDGTAPHVVDPVLVGARDRLLDMTVCLDTEALEPRLNEIEVLQKDISAQYARAYHYLKGADEIIRATEEIYERLIDKNAMAAVYETLSALLPSHADAPVPEKLFAQAITHKGVVSFVDDALTGTVYTLDCPFGYPAHLILSDLARESERRALKGTQYMDPLNAARIAHLSFPSVTFTTAADGDTRLVPLPYDKQGAQKYSQTLAFHRAAHDLLLNQAVEALASAKTQHDALERIYMDAMDYDRLATLRQKLFAELALK